MRKVSALTMTDTATIEKLRERLNMTRASIDAYKMRLDVMEKEARRLEIALDVLEKLGNDTVDADTNPMSMFAHVTGNVFARSSLSPLAPNLMDIEEARKRGLIYGEMFSPTTKQQIDAQFASGESLTRLEVVQRMKSLYPEVNEGTVATTLSKLAAEGRLEKVEGNKYRRKADTAGAGNTRSGEDLL